MSYRAALRLKYLRPVAILILAFAVVGMPLRRLWAQGPGVYVSVGLLAGSYETHLEDRFQDDRQGAAILLLNGYGENSPWQGKDHVTLPLLFGFHYDEFFGELQFYQTSVSPSYTGFLATSNANLNNTSVALSSVETGKIDIERMSTTLRGGAAIGLNETVHWIFGIGLRRLLLDTDYEIARATNIVLNTSSLSASFVDFSVATNSLALARGPTLFTGLRIRSGAWEFQFELGFFSLAGRREYNVVELSASSTPAVVLNAQREEGDLQVRGFEYLFRAGYRVREELTVFVALRGEAAAVRDRRVVSAAGTTASSTLETVNGLRIDPLRFLTTYPGSAQPDYFGGIEFGVERRFDFSNESR
ncbi:MAG: hypothetical protein H7A22_09240 [Spirochaetales bacterium]|nr:hypothetical protein [Spirochaetales bacterium]